jgi:hypothetical protein
VNPRALMALLRYEDGSLWLYQRLQQTHAWAALPKSLQEDLRARALEAAAIGLRVDEEARSVLARLSRAGIPAILIKGVARRALAARYPLLGARLTRDVDLLLPSAELPAAFELLRGAGYEPAERAFEAAPHLPPLWNERRVAVELHGSSSLRVPASLAWARATAGGLEVDWDGLPVRTPSPTELLWQAAQHALSRSFAEGFRLRNFLEAAALLAGGAPIDWEEIAERLRAEPAHDPASGHPVPASVLTAWLGAGRALAGAPCPRTPFDLVALLEWRLLVLSSRERLGPRMAERLLEEAPRVLAGAPPAGPPAGVAGWRRLRRPASAWIARGAFAAWRTLRTGYLSRSGVNGSW